MLCKGNVLCSGRYFFPGGHFNTGLVIFMELAKIFGLGICRGNTSFISFIIVTSGSTSISAE